MKSTLKGPYNRSLPAFACALLLGTTGLLSVCAGCGSRSGNENSPQEAKVMSLSNWIGQLRDAYLEEGTQGFDEKRERMIAKEHTLRDERYYDPAAVVLGLDRTKTANKEAAAAALRALARQIEAHPGRSRKAYERLERDLSSYCFGNGEIDYGSVPTKLMELYFVIATTSGDRLTVNVEQLFGKYLATDYAWCSVSAPSPRESWARQHLDYEAAVLPEVFAMRGVAILNPRYKMCAYPKSFEGDVPTGVRRRLSDFYGAGNQRAFITVLEVYEPGAAYPRYDVEIIDENTLWEMWDGPWLFEWRREGIGTNPIPLKERALGGSTR